jgi:ferric-dicitrate binding protein FerR (iron transport regulator)
MKIPSLAMTAVLLFSAWAGAQTLNQERLPLENGAVIQELSGTVELKAAGTVNWVPAKRGDTLLEDTTISTGFRSSALLAIGNSAVLVRPITRLTLRELVRLRGEERIKLELQTGKLRAEVNPPSGGSTTFTVQSPKATASVRGTVFEFDTINLLVEEGSVRLLGEGGGRTVLVQRGQSGRVDENSERIISPAQSIIADLAPAQPAAAAESGFVTTGSGENLPAGITLTIDLIE